MRALVEFKNNEQHIVRMKKIKFHKINDMKVEITLVAKDYGLLKIQVPESAAHLYKSQLVERGFANFSGLDVDTTNYTG